MHRSAPGTHGVDNGGQVSSRMRFAAGWDRRGVAKVAEYRAIFGGVSADRIPIRCTSDENLFTVS